MTNKIIIDFDSERPDRFLFSKPEDIPQPKNHDEAKKMILLDIACLSEAITRLILMAHDSGYTTKDDLIFSTVNTIYQGLHEETIENQKLLSNNEQ
jgi:hypothetical protein